MISGKLLSVILVVSVAVIGFSLVTLNSALGQHGQYQHEQQPKTTKQQKKEHPHGGMMHGKEAGGMMHSPEEMQQMMSHMANNPEMLKHHLTMMMNDSELRSAVVKLLREDAEMRQMFENLLSEARK